MFDHVPVLFHVCGENHDVIHVYNNMSVIEQFLEQVIHHGLECYWGVCQSKEHYQWFKESLIGDKGCLMFIPFLYLDIVVPSSDIKPCEDACMA